MTDTHYSKDFFWMVALVFISLCCFPSCGGSKEKENASDPKVVEGTCEINASADSQDESDGGAETDGGSASDVEFLKKIGCTSDFAALASEPVDATLSGARSVKVVLDTADNNALYFQNSVLYNIHYEFVSTHLSGNGLPQVPALAEFNAQYTSTSRRFILAAVTYYEGPKKWTLEFAPYDTASAEMITTLYTAIQKAAFFGPALLFHPTSDSVAAVAQKLSSTVRIITTDDLYANTDYQPLTLATGIGYLRFVKAADLATEYLSFQDLIVIDEVPNDISVVRGIISQEFQTPLSHVNVLSQNRKTPNMGLRGAMTNKELLALKGKMVELTVGPIKWRIREVTEEEAAVFFEEHKPAAVTLPSVDKSVTDIVDIEDVTPDPDDPAQLRDALLKATLAYGGKAAQYSVLAKTSEVPVKKAFGVPVYYYEQFMADNGFYDRLDALLNDDQFINDPSVRDTELAKFRADMLTAPVDEVFQERLRAKINEGYQHSKVRFRTSTNSEDLDGFPCAGCYESQSGDPADWNDILDALRLTYTSVWLFRTFEERSYYGVDHKSVSMALLVHNDFPEEEANGVAVTNNPFDLSELEPAYYVNVQYGGFVEVVHPMNGVYSEQFLLYYAYLNEDVTYISRSNLVPEDATVLSRTQRHKLARALTAIKNRFSYAYGSGAGIYGWWAMDVEFKFDDDENPGEEPALYIKQARPYPKPTQSQ
jgi:hypothetical protein